VVDYSSITTIDQMVKFIPPFGGSPGIYGRSPGGDRVIRGFSSLKNLEGGK